VDAKARDSNVSLVRLLTPAIVLLLLAGALRGRLEIAEPPTDVEPVLSVCLVGKLFTF
jgi:hypothetical protein